MALASVGIAPAGTARSEWNDNERGVTAWSKSYWSQRWLQRERNSTATVEDVSSTSGEHSQSDFNSRTYLLRNALGNAPFEYRWSNRYFDATVTIRQHNMQPTLSDVRREITSLIDAYDDKVTDVSDRLDELERKAEIGTLQPQGVGNRNKILEGLGRYALNNDTSGLAVSNEMQIKDDPGGGYLVIPELSEEIGEIVKEVSPFRELARVRQIRADAWEQIWNLQGTSSAWGSEGGSVPETDTPTFATIRIPLRKLIAEPHVTEEHLGSAFIDVGEFLMDEIGTEFGTKEAAAFITGDDLSQPKGILDYDTSTDDDGSRDFNTVQYVPTGAAGAFASSNAGDALITLIHKLHSRYRRNATWIMNSATIAAVRKIKDGDGNYLWRDSFERGQPNMLLGYPVVDVTDMPDIAANSFSIAFGDWQRAYSIIEHEEGLGILRDPYTTKGKVKFYSKKRIGGAVTNTEALKLLKFSAS